MKRQESKKVCTFTQEGKEEKEEIRKSKDDTKW